MRLGVIGATGLVGRRMVAVLDRSGLPLATLQLWATERGAGETIPFGGEKIRVDAWEESAAGEIDVALLATKSDVSRALAPRLAAAGVIVVDNSRAFRMQPDVPLIVPEVNAAALAEHSGIIANPNCSTIQLAVALQPLQAAAGLARVVVATYQSVSGAGRTGLQALREECVGKVVEASPFPHPIHGNVIPQCDDFIEEGWTREEWKLQVETRKILALPDLDIAATCARVPVAVGHSEAVTVDLQRPLTPGEARRLWHAAPGVVVEDDPARNIYPLARTVTDRDEVFIGRIRCDAQRPQTLHFWVVADNLLKGAAGNAVEIVAALLEGRAAAAGGGGS
ncbi:MAG: aspartate-semialdehyde dehydrogenase [Candidatus Eisenbacteria bacterium]|nr:aspartate-semialdehyde dehydrogenase [Candidatus Eisenbacteria bacterium]